MYERVYSGPIAILSEAFQARPDVLWDAETRRAYLESLPHAGFTREQHGQLVDDIVSVGLPVNNFQTLVRRPSKLRREVVLGSWGIGEDVEGEFSVYQALDWLPREATRDTVVHEGTHANSPLNPDNVALFGGERSRHEAEEFARRAAGQTLLTGRYLDGYHHFLASMYYAGEIPYEHFVEETSAIACQQALTNRAHLQQVEDAQRKVIEHLQPTGMVGKDFEFTELLSHPSAAGAELAGADKTLVKLLDGVETYQDLIRHSARVKTRFSSALSPEMPARPVLIWPEQLLGGVILRFVEVPAPYSRN